MKKIEAVFRRERLAEVKFALERQGYAAVTVSHAQGLATPRSGWEWLVSDHGLGSLPYAKLELLVRPDDVYRVTTAIMGAARTGAPDDGTILVSTVEDAVLIGNGDPVYEMSRLVGDMPLSE